MKVFILDLNKLDSPKKELVLSKYNDNRKFTNDLKKLQHCSGLYLTDFVAKNFYNIKNPKIIYVNNKPVFVNSNLKFSISHSKNIVAVGFSNENIGIDIEYNKKKRDFIKIINKVAKNFKIIDSKSFSEISFEEQQRIFYEYWTQYEATIKLNSKQKEIVYYTEEILNDFTLSVVTETPVDFTGIKIV